MYYTRLLIMLLFLNTSVVFSENNTLVDSLNNIVNNSEDTVKSDALIDLAKYYYYDNNYYQAIKYVNQSIKIIPNDNIRLAMSNNFLGLIYYQVGDYPTALSYHLISLKYREEINNETLTSVAYNSIGVVYTALDNPEKSNYYLQKALVIELKNNNIKNLAMLYNNISNNLSRQKKYNKALKYLLKSEKIISDTDLDKALLLINIGKGYSNINNSIKAKEYYFTAIDYCKETNNSYYLSLAYQNIGMFFLSQKDYSQALFFLNNSMQISKRIRSNDVLKDNYKELINVYSVTNKPDSVLKYNKLYYAINDSIFNKQTADKIAELQIKYDFEKKEKEIENLKIKNELADRNQKIIIAFFILLTLVIIIIALIVLNQKRKLLADKLSIEKSLKLIKYEDVIDNSIDEIVNVTPVEQPKDTSSTLSEEFKTMLEVSISKKIRKEKLYLNSDFSLNELAKILDTNRRYVSQVINERFDKNFNSFINEFRIKEAMRLMSNPEYKKYTIDSISKEVGFNSISAFNGAFKKVTGVTPSAFVNSLK